MKARIISPTKAYIEDADLIEIDNLDKALSYTNTSVSFQLSKHYKNRWFKEKNPVEWEEVKEALEDKKRGYLLERDSAGRWTRPGILPYLKNMTIVNQVSYPALKPLKWKHKPEFEPYPYQTESVARLIASKHGNISLPTGCGKSFILLLLAQQMGLDAVIVTPSQSIFTELLESFQHHLGKDMVGGYGDGYKDISKKITIAIGKSLAMLEPGTKNYEFFQKKQVMLVDESHTFAAEQLNDVCHGVLADVPYRMFVSATQTRNDGTEKLLAAIIGETVFEMSLKDAMDQGFLCPLKFTVLSLISPDSRRIADPTKNKRVHFLYNRNIASVAARLANSSWEMKQESTLILVEELEQIEMLSKLLKVPFGYVHSADKKKAKEFNLVAVDTQEQILKFNTGEIKVLIGTKAISTGTNLFPTHNVINWMGGASEIITKQGAMGRSTRKLEISKYKQYHIPKPHTMIYDFRVKGNDMLDKHLIKRCSWYQESGGELRYF